MYTLKLLQQNLRFEFFCEELKKFQLDPEMMNDASDGSLNMLLLKLTTQKVVTQITRSATLCPWFSYFLFIHSLSRQIRKIIIHIKEEVSKKFPGCENVTMGAFLFLRYFIPAIAVPSEFGILKRISPL